MLDERWEEVKNFTWFKNTQQEVTEYVEELRAQVAQLKQWVSDTQSGMYINCVYCGHRYGPADTTPASKAYMLKEHIEVCPEHPMSKLKKKYTDLETSAKLHLQMSSAMLNTRYMLNPGMHIAFFAACTQDLEEALKRAE